MFFTTLWALLLMLTQAATRLAALAIGEVFGTDEAGIPPVYLTWNDGRQFTIHLKFTRVK